MSNFEPARSVFAENSSSLLQYGRRFYSEYAKIGLHDLKAVTSAWRIKNDMGDQ